MQVIHFVSYHVKVVFGQVSESRDVPSSLIKKDVSKSDINHLACDCVLSSFSEEGWLKDFPGSISNYSHVFMFLTHTI